MLFEKQKIILLHPGKTGGTSVESALVGEYLGKPMATFVRNHKYGDFDLMFGLDGIRNVYLQHACLRLYEMFDTPMRKYDVFCTVRRPYERVLSAYYYNGFSKRMTFEVFVNTKLSDQVKANYYERSKDNNSITDYPKYHINHFAPAVLYTSRGRFKVKNIIKCESLARDTKKLLGLTIPKQKMAQTVASEYHKKHLDAYTTQKMKDKVYSLYLEDFKTFGYKR